MSYLPKLIIYYFMFHDKLMLYLRNSLNVLNNILFIFKTPRFKNGNKEVKCEGDGVFNYIARCGLVTI